MQEKSELFFGSHKFFYYGNLFYICTKPNKMQERLEFEEFENELWDYVSHKIVSRNYIRTFEEFSSGVAFDLYYLYLKGVDIKVLSKTVEIFFSNLFVHRSSCENLPEEFHLDDF